MTSLRQALHHSIHLLKDHGIEDSHIEARALLQFITGLSAAEVYASPERMLTKKEERRLKGLLQRRLCREPLAYITNKKEFYGLDFYVDQRVLIPRPETELLVETAIEFATGKASPYAKTTTIADIGTGCGAIAISLAVNLPTCIVYATDISHLALEVARINCQRHNVSNRVILLHGNLLEPLHNPVDIIVANLPYISSTELPTLEPEVREFEPEIALNGGNSGLELIQQLLSQVEQKINPAGCLILEIAHDQQEDLASILHGNFRAITLDFISDLGGVKRVARITFP